MAKEPEPAPEPPKSSGFGFFVVVAAIAMIAYVAMRSTNQSDEKLAGVMLPPLEVQGWFNVPRPLTNADLRGKVVLLDCWFVGCPPCRAAMPRLVEFNNRFRSQGVQLVGLTVDTGEDARQAETFAKSIPGLDWPVGYGAQIPVMDILGIHEFPTLVLFDKSGRAVWAGHSEQGLEAATIAALAAAP
jgi:thiol-disulfide isomerase/thioredoxin